MFHNYKTWELDTENFNKQESPRDKLKFLAQFGTLAPSSHNAQPWLFKIGEKTIEVFPDPSRHLKYSDPTERMLYLSIGAVVENIKTAATYFGLKTSLKYNLEHSLKDPEAVVTMNFEEGCQIENTDEELFKAILKRASYRGSYKSQKLPKEVFEKIESLNTEDVKIAIKEDPQQKREAANAVARGVKEKMSQRKFRWELAKWLRKNFTLQSDGMPGSGHEMNLRVSLIAPWALRFIDVSEFEKNKALNRVPKFPAILIMGTREDTPYMWVKAGEKMEQILLYLYSKGLSASIMVAGIESKRARKQLQKIATKNERNYTKDLLPQMFIGFGFADHPAPHSPRRRIENMLKT